MLDDDYVCTTLLLNSAREMGLGLSDIKSRKPDLSPSLAGNLNEKVGYSKIYGYFS